MGRVAIVKLMGPGRGPARAVIRPRLPATLVARPWSLLDGYQLG